MRRFLLITQTVVVLAVSLIAAEKGLAQITITSNDFPVTIGERFFQYIMEDTTEPGIPVDIGSSGAGQSWSFDPAQYRGGAVLETVVVDPAATQFADSFTVADFAWKQAHPFEPITWFQYFDLTANELLFLGIAVIQPDTQVAGVLAPARKSAVFPMTYNTSWTQSGSDTATVDSAGITLTTIVHTLITDSVDAWGTIQVPSGTFPCLRIQNNIYVTFLMLLNGFPFYTWTVRTITYNWVAENVGIVATIQSKAGETDPNFTMAQMVTIRVANPSAVGVKEMSANKKFHLHDNYPNPFNPETVIEYQLLRSVDIEISIFNVEGKKVTTLASGFRPAGSYKVTWGGKDESGRMVASGLYIYQLKAGDSAEIKKMTLLQ